MEDCERDRVTDTTWSELRSRYKNSGSNFISLFNLLFHPSFNDPSKTLAQSTATHHSRNYHQLMLTLI